MLIVILAVALLLRLVVMGRSIAYDEAYAYCAYVKRGFFETFLQPYNASNHLLNSLFTDWSVGLLGPGVFSLRLPALLFGLGSIAVAYVLFRRLEGKGFAVLGATLMALGAFHIRFSTESRGYAAMLFFVLLMVYFVLDARERRAALPWLFAGASFVLAAFANLFTVILAIPVALFVSLDIFLWRRWPSKAECAGMAAALGAEVVAIYALYAPTLPFESYFLHLLQHGTLPGNAFHVFAVQIHPFDMRFVGEMFARWGWGGGIALGLALAFGFLGLIAACRGGRSREATLFLLLTFLPFALAKLIGFATVYRLFFYAIPFYVYFVTAGIFQLARWMRPRGLAAATVCVCVVVLAWPSAGYVLGNGTTGKDGDWKAAYAFFEEHRDTDDFLLGDPPGEPASHEGIAVEFYDHETVQSGSPEALLDGDIGLWRMQFAAKPAPEGFRERFAAKDVKLYHRRVAATLEKRWPRPDSPAPVVLLWGREGRLVTVKPFWDAGTGSLRFVMPAGHRAVIRTGFFPMEPASPYVVHCKQAQALRGHMRLDFKGEELWAYPLDIRRLNGADSILMPGYSWKDARLAQIAMRFQGAEDKEVQVRLTDLTVYVVVDGIASLRSQ